MKNVLGIKHYHVPYSIRELLLFGAGPVVVRFVFSGVLSATEIRSWIMATSVLAIAGGAEGLSIAMAQSKLPPCSHPRFPMKWWYLTMVTGSILAWIFVLGPALSMTSLLSGLNLIGTSKVLILFAVLGALFGGVIGISQYFAYRRMYSNSSVLIVSKSIAWILLTVVSLGALHLLRMPATLSGIIVVIISSCLLSGAIQILERNVTSDLLHTRKSGPLGSM